MKNITDNSKIGKLWEESNNAVYKIVDRTKPAKSKSRTVGGSTYWVHEDNHKILHNEYGPSIITNYGAKWYYLFDKHYPRVEDWAKVVLQLHKKPIDDSSIHQFLQQVLKKDMEESL